MSVSDRKKTPSPLRTERLQRHWTQQDVADHVGANVATVKRWERGMITPGPYFRLRLTALFSKSEEALGLRGNDEISIDPPTDEEISTERLSTPTPGEFSPSPNALTPLWIVPYPRNPYFTGRDNLLQRLDACLATSPSSILPSNVAVQPRVALTGLGGIGKTQTAIEYAYRMRDLGSYTHVLWINAAYEEAIASSFSACAALLPARSIFAQANQQQIVHTVKTWLEQCSDRWLLIFDNADDLSYLSHYLPHHGNGSILFTTRVHAVGSLATPIEVDTLSSIEATRLLIHRAQRLGQLSDEQIDIAAKLAIDLDAFPLALDQAGAYIEETGCTFDTYLHLYQTNRETLLARRGTQLSYYHDSVATTWSLCFEHIQRTEPAAAQLLQLCAFLSPDHLSEELFTEGAPFWPAPLQQAVTNLFAFNQILETLLHASLIKRLSQMHMLSIHRLVQVVQVAMIDEEQRRQWAERVVQAVAFLFPHRIRDDVESWPRCLRYLEQVQICSQLITQYGLQSLTAADLLERAGTYLYTHASYSQAEVFYQQALQIRQAILGTNDDAVGDIFHALGRLCWQQARYQQAESYYQQALTIRKEQRGDRHSSVAATLDTLGILYYDQARYQQAESYYQQALTIYQDTFSPHHLGIAFASDNLGQLYTKQHKYGQAESCLRRSLAIRKEHLGERHPATVGVLDNLGVLYREQGRDKQAENYCLQALNLCQEILGAHHPTTAEILRDLAQVYQNQQRYAQAEPLFIRALFIQEHMLPHNHPEFARTLHSLAYLYQQQEKIYAAQTFYQRALTIREHVYGPHNPETQKTRECLQATQRSEHALLSN
jgi:tetratricopeptide (TPR) repeat protein/transcriptional regulator with XRE-family HTH domain